MPTKKAHRRGNKEGSIYQRKDGKWCGQVLTGYNELGKPIRKTYYGVTRQEVAEKVSGTVHQVFSGTAPVSTKKITLENLLTDYLWTFKKSAVADMTFDWYLSLNKNHITPILGNIAADAVTVGQVQGLINGMHGKGLARRSIKAVRDILNQTYVHAEEVKLCGKNPTVGTKLPATPREKSEDDNARVITRADRASILAAAENDIRMKTAITVLMFTGMRIGEFLALTWGSIDFENGVITVDRAITHKCEYDEERNLTSRETVVGTTKTQCSTRKVKVTPIVMDALQAWRVYLPEHLRSTPSHDVLSPDAVVFPNDMGAMRTYDGFRTTYRRFMSEHGLKSYPLHSYRHTFATMLLESGTNPRVVQKLLGHRDIETTLEIYSHVLPEVFDSAADALTVVYEGMKNSVSI
jgi:integrase